LPLDRPRVPFSEGDAAIDKPGEDFGTLGAASMGIEDRLRRCVRHGWMILAIAAGPTCRDQFGDDEILDDLLRVLKGKA
jgi:hypothetical protein